MKILLPSDVVSIKIKDITFFVSPMTQSMKSEMDDLIKIKEGKEYPDRQKQLNFVIKNSVKKITGATKIDGSPLEIVAAEDGKIKDDDLETAIAIADQCGQALLYIFKLCNNSLDTDLFNPLKPTVMDGVEFQYVPKM